MSRNKVTSEDARQGKVRPLSLEEADKQSTDQLDKRSAEWYARDKKQRRSRTHTERESLKVTLDPAEEWSIDPRNRTISFLDNPWSLSERDLPDPKPPFWWPMIKYGGCGWRREHEAKIRRDLAATGYGFDPEKVRREACEHAIHWAQKKGWTPLGAGADRAFKRMIEQNPAQALYDAIPAEHWPEVNKFTLQKMKFLEDEILNRQTVTRKDLADKVRKKMEEDATGANERQVASQYTGVIKRADKKMGLNDDEFSLALHYLNEDFSRDLRNLWNGHLSVAVASRRWPEIYTKSWRTIPRVKRSVERHQATWTLRIEEARKEGRLSGDSPVADKDELSIAVKALKDDPGRKMVFPGQMLLLCWEVRKAIWHQSHSPLARERHFTKACEVVGIQDPNKTIRDQRQRLEGRIQSLRQAT